MPDGAIGRSQALTASAALSLTSGLVWQMDVAHGGGNAEIFPNRRWTHVLR